MTKPKIIVMDSWPMMAYLQGESAAKRVVDIIADAHANGDELLMSVVNAGEIWYTIAKRAAGGRADEAIDLIRSLGIKFIDVDWETTKIAATYKTKGGISYADTFAAALAKQHKATLITGDPEFKQLEKEITINWL
jgi:predicted nucleic acid-binding protein